MKKVLNKQFDCFEAERKKDRYRITGAILLFAILLLLIFKEIYAFKQPTDICLEKISSSISLEKSSCIQSIRFSRLNIWKDGQSYPFILLTVSGYNCEHKPFCRQVLLDDHPLQKR